MASKHWSGMDELMIVNPGSPLATRAVTLRRRRAPRVGEVTTDPQTSLRAPARSRFFLGSDGTLYEVIDRAD